MTNLLNLFFVINNKKLKLIVSESHIVWLGFGYARVTKDLSPATEPTIPPARRTRIMNAFSISASTNTLSSFPNPHSSSYPLQQQVRSFHFLH